MTSAPSLLQLLSGNEDNKIMAVADLPHGNTHTDSERERERESNAYHSHRIMCLGRDSCVWSVQFQISCVGLLKGG